MFYNRSNIFGTEAMQLSPYDQKSGFIMEKLLKSLPVASAPVFSARDQELPGISTSHTGALCRAFFSYCMSCCMRMPR